MRCHRFIILGLTKAKLSSWAGRRTWGCPAAPTIAFSSKPTEPLQISPLLKVPSSFGGGAGLAGKTPLLDGKNAWAGTYLCWLMLGAISRKTLESEEGCDSSARALSRTRVPDKVCGKCGENAQLTWKSPAGLEERNVQVYPGLGRICPATEALLRGAMFFPWSSAEHVSELKHHPDRAATFPLEWLWAGRAPPGRG